MARADPSSRREYSTRARRSGAERPLYNPPRRGKHPASGREPSERRLMRDRIRRLDEVDEDYEEEDDEEDQEEEEEDEEEDEDEDEEEDEGGWEVGSIT